VKTVVTGTEMKDLDANTITNHHMPSLVLMERAALASVEVLESENFNLDEIAIICGPGNNGGDGIAIGRLLHLRGHNVHIVVVGDSEKQTPETRKQILIATSYHAPITTFSSIKSHRKLTTIIDALFGIGAVRTPSGEFLDAITWINSHRQAGTKVLAIDIPSGVSADTGQTPGAAVQADATVSFAFTKVGLTQEPGSTLAGIIVIKDIGIYQYLTKPNSS
jgi:NAD(P)H-hydrate epimerase